MLVYNEEIPKSRCGRSGLDNYEYIVHTPTSSDIADAKRLLRIGMLLRVFSLEANV